MVYVVTIHKADRGQWKIILISEVPAAGTKILLAVWAKQSERKILLHEVFIWKARLNVRGTTQMHRVDYWEMFTMAPRWIWIQFFLVQSIINRSFTS
jgi:hypothetical protein